MRYPAFGLAALLVATPVAAVAQTPLPGFFIARSACPATPSTKRPDNPGDVTVEAMRAYDMIGINKPGGAFFQIRVPDAPETAARWVGVGCGVHVVEAGTAVDDGGGGNGGGGDGGGQPAIDPPGPPEWTDNLLTLSWQPAFCEIRPNKDECIALNAGDMPGAVERLSVHGLWPQPNGNFYCGVPQAVREIDRPATWFDLPAVDMDAATRAALADAMPGMASGLHRHEWIKHGTCYRAAGGADEYYDDTLLLTEAVNASGLADFLAARVGQEVAIAEIEDVVEAAFGPGASDRIQVQCTDDGTRVLLGEVWIALLGEITPDADVGALIRAAEPFAGHNCDGRDRVVIDPAGLQ